MSKFKDIARQYIDKEMAVTPVINGKGPFLKKWNSMGERVLDSIYDKAWKSSDGLALVTGSASGIIALDIDIDSDTEDLKKQRIRAELEKILPPVFCGRNGSKKRPTLRFFQHQLIDYIGFPSIGVEILSNKACVLPPSTHPEGHRYEWVGKSLLDIEIDDLPMLPENVLDFLFYEENKAVYEKSLKDPNLKKKIKKDHQLLTYVRGRCKSGSHNYFSKIGVAMRYKQKTKEEIVERLLELDKKHNAESDFLYFECRTRRWPRGQSMRDNAEQFVQEIIENHDPENADTKLLYEEKLQDGFFYEKQTRDGSIRMVPDYNALSDYFKDVLRYRYSDEKAYIYGDGFYEPIQPGGVNALIDDLTLRQASPAHFNPFKIKIQANCYTDFSGFLPPPRTLNLNNGVLFLDSKEIKPHDPTYAFKYKLPHNYNPKTKCPRFLNFLVQTFNDDSDLINLIGEIMGYTLMGGEPTAHRAFAFYGDGRNGKSTLLDVIMELLGKENVSAVSMKNIDKPFSTVSLDGKIANIVEESPAKIDAEAFKNIVGGGYVTAAHKGKPEYDLKVQARLFFACNKLPVFRESTVAIKDRIIFVPFVNYIKKKDRDVRIKERLNAEIEGVLNFAIEGLERYRAHGFTEPRASEALMHEYQKESDSVFDWACENISVTFKFDDYVLTEDAYNSYIAHCGRNRVREVSRKSFDKRFAKYLSEVINDADNNFTLNDIKKQQDVTRRWGYTCLTLKI